METKPIVTSHGNQVLFSSLHKAMLESLPKESAEWRRSYGRPARNVHLEASFVPYDDDILPDDTDKTLISRPYFHIFWTDCDLETFRSKVREEIGDWCSALKGKSIPDWLIVVVNNEDNKVKTKLLPRSSVYDKIKSDFCSKHPDRIIVLNDPLKQEGKSLESWNVFIGRLRSMLLQAFTRHLQKYEDNMRALREKRNEVGWNFQQYFIVQEELAFMFEMLGLFDDAMIQYDELDALFSQFILNHASGRLQQIEATYIAVSSMEAELHPLLKKQLSTEKTLRLESVPWLSSLVCPCKTWAGLSLRKALSWDKRNLIKDNEASLLEFRNYMFSRQCALLFLMGRPGEILQRAVDYLHQTVQEMKTLEIEISVGCLDCWVFLSGLEVLQRCEKLSDTTQPRTQALNTAYLWDYVCRKLRHLGELCGLMPDSHNKSPSSQQLSLVIDLTAGMGLEEEQDDEEEEQGPKVLSPRDRLREALTSKESFQRIYLEQSELAMGTFKHIGRFRSARMIGKNLADFYMKLGEPQKAENLLLDAMSSYHHEGWKVLRDQSRLELAVCQLQEHDTNKYIKTACQVASSSLLEDKDRNYHLDQIKQIAANAKDTKLVKASPLFKVDIASISSAEVTLDERFSVTVTLGNHSLQELQCDTVWLTLTECSPDTTYHNPRLGQLKQPVMRQASNSSLDNRKVMNETLEKKQLPSTIDLRLHYEGRPGSPVATGITCVNSHELLTRKDSTGVTLKSLEEVIVKDTYSQSVSLGDVVLNPGTNTLTFECEGIKAGHYKAGQVGIKVGRLEFLKDTTSDLTVTVVCDETYCEIIPDTILAGVKSDVTVRLHSGSTPVEDDSKVKVIASDDLTVVMADLDNTDNTVTTGRLGRGEVQEWSMVLFQEPRVTTGTSTIQNKLVFDCSWLPRPLMTQLTFQNPFHITHKLHTAKEMKYVQVSVQGQSLPEFSMTDWSLEATNSKDVELVRLNKPGQTLKVNIYQHPSCMWQLKSNLPELPPLELLFTMHYCCLTDPAETPKQTSYKFSVKDYQTQFTVKTDVTSLGESKQCKTGSLCVLKLQVRQLPGCRQPADQDYMYDVDGETNWTIHGKSTGVFSMASGSYTTSLEVMPLTTGFIPLPKLQLYKYKATTPAQEIWTKKADLEKCELDSTDDDSSETDVDDAGGRPPNHAPFDDGQVYYSSLGRQVHVYPESSTGEIEISVIN